MEQHATILFPQRLKLDPQVVPVPVNPDNPDLIGVGPDVDHPTVKGEKPVILSLTGYARFSSMNECEQSGPSPACSRGRAE